MISTAMRANITAHLRTITAPASAAEIAAALGKARSTVTTALRDLEQAGEAVRTPGGRDNGRRQPDLWSAPLSEVPAQASEEARAGEESTPATAPSAPYATAPVKGASPQAVAVNPVTKTTRLQPGALRQMVHAILRGSPQEEFSPTEISHLLRGRSVGAIQNALARLVNDGQAVLTCEAPRRYSAI